MKSKQRLKTEKLIILPSALHEFFWSGIENWGDKTNIYSDLVFLPFCIIYATSKKRTLLPNLHTNTEEMVFFLFDKNKMFSTFLVLFYKNIPW